MPFLQTANEYVGVLKRAEALIEKANVAVGERNTRGMYCPVITVEDLNLCIDECREWSFKLQNCIRALTVDSPKKGEYQEKYQRILTCIDELKRLRKDLLEKKM